MGAAVALLALALGFVGLPARADYSAGLGAYRIGDFATALTEWRPLAEAGDARAQHGLGLLYEAGQGVAPDLKLAVRWYEAAAAQGLAAAKNNLALLYAEGRGVVRNAYRAVELWREASDAGYPMAQYNLGLAYYRGVGLNKNYREAVKWFSAAGDRGVVDAQYALGECYRLGRGVKQADDVARTWYAAAARAGHAGAIGRLRDVYGVTEIPPAPEAVAEAVVPVPVPEVAEPVAESEEADASAETPDVELQPAVPATVEDAAAPTTAVEAGSEGEGDEQAVDEVLAVEALGSGDQYRIWLASLQTQGGAETYWERLVRDMPDLLESLELMVRKVDLGAEKGIWFRVLAGPLPARQQAEELCMTIVRRRPGENCVVMKN